MVDQLIYINKLVIYNLHTLNR